MYQFSKNLKLTAFGLIIVGLLGIGYGFYSAPSTVEEAKAMVAHGDDHGNDHGTAGEPDRYSCGKGIRPPEL